MGNSGEGKTQKTERTELRRELGLVNCTSLIIGSIIGSGIFISPTNALARSGSVGLCLVVWATSGVISTLGALAFAELGTVVPKSGAEYAYFGEAFGHLHPFWGPLPSFICAWIYVVFLKPAEVAVISLTFAEYVAQPFYVYFSHLSAGNVSLMKSLIAVAAVGIMTAINIYSVKLYIKFQNIFTSLKLVACAVVIGGGVYYLTTGRTQNLQEPFKGSTRSARDIALAFYSGLWAYDGWSSVTVVTEEVKHPEKNFLRSISIALPLVTIVYILMNVSYMTVLSIPEMLAAPAVAVVFGDRLLGPVNFLIPLGVAMSTFGCAMAAQFSVARLCYVAGRSGHMLQVTSYVHITRMTPAPAIALQALLSLAFILSGDIASLIDFVSFLIWIFYGTAMVALLLLRRTRKDAYRPYKVPILIPMFILVVSIFLAVVPIVTDPAPEYLLAVGFIVAGVMVYTVCVYYKKTPTRLLRKLTYMVQMLMQVAPPDQQDDATQKKPTYVVEIMMPVTPSPPSDQKKIDSGQEKADDSNDSMQNIPLGGTEVEDQNHTRHMSSDKSQL